MIRLLLADDHRMLREGLRRSLQAEGFEVVGEAADGHEAFRMALELRPDVVLMDVTMPVLDGVEATRLIHGSMPGMPVVMLTMHADGDVMARALQAGRRRLPGEGLRHRGGRGHRPHGGRGRRRALRRPGLVDAGRDAAGRRRRPPGRERQRQRRPHVISAREEEVLQLFADGLSLPEVAAQLFISVKTVKNHLASIYAKLDARDRTQAVLRAVRMGIIRLTPPEA